MNYETEQLQLRETALAYAVAQTFDKPCALNPPCWWHPDNSQHTKRTMLLLLL
jgi:hypothetical protein